MKKNYDIEYGENTVSTALSKYFSFLSEQIVTDLLDRYVYCDDERLLHNTQEREKIMKEVELFTNKSLLYYVYCTKFYNVSVHEKLSEKLASRYSFFSFD